MEITRKQHWETIYSTKKLEEVSWYQPKPEFSLDLLNKYGCKPTDAIIDIGGGDSFLVDFLVKEQFEALSVLDISENALQRAQNRLGTVADKVDWIVSDITEFKPKKQYDFWHDRAVFHFLTQTEDIKLYAEKAANGIKTGGVMIVGTFSENGPLKCSGIEIKQYNESTMKAVFENDFEHLVCKMHIHTTPAQTQQQFIFCVFRRK
jgi:cyclopropane fatty-acyl-phospholipid synthase-like methyltransferase